MNNVQRSYRISDRKIVEEDLKKIYLGDNIMELKKKDSIKKVLSDAGMRTDEKFIQWVYRSADDLNLYMKMDQLDGRVRNIHRMVLDDRYVMTVVPMEDGSHRISIEDADEDNYKCANTKFGNDELSSMNQLVYDIYSGCPRFEWDLDWQTHAKHALSVIDKAKDGDTFRRDIFSCESYGLTFVPIDIINLKVHVDGKMKDRPYITGLLYQEHKDGSITYKPYALKTSIGHVSSYYLNESIVIPGESISLAGMNNLFIQVVSEDSRCTDVLRVAMARLMNAKMRNVKVNTLEPYTAFKKIEFSDDAYRELADPLDILPQLLKPNTFKTAM